MNKFDCMYYDEEIDCCGALTNYAMGVVGLVPCSKHQCKMRKPRPLLQKPKRTNFDRITESVESLAEIMDNYRWCPYFSNSTCNSEIECKECIIEWLQKECDND